MKQLSYSIDQPQNHSYQNPLNYKHNNIKCIKFQFPIQSIMLQQYSDILQFQQWVRDCNISYLGFPQIIKYVLVDKQIQNIQNKNNVFRMLSYGLNLNKNNNKKLDIQHKWCCQICYSYIQYSWNSNKKMYVLQRYDRGHVHMYDNFRDYLVQDCNKRFNDNVKIGMNGLLDIQNCKSSSNNNEQTENNIDQSQTDRVSKRQDQSMYQQSQCNTLLEQRRIKVKQKDNQQQNINNIKEITEQKKQNIYEQMQQHSETQNINQKFNQFQSKFFDDQVQVQVYGQTYGLDKKQMNFGALRKKKQNQYQDYQNNKKRKVQTITKNISKKQNKRKVKQFQNQNLNAQNYKKSEKQFINMLPAKNTVWCKQTQSLILYLKPHYFYCPMPTDLPFSLPADIKISDLNQQLRQIYKSYRQCNNQIWQTETIKVIRQKKSTFQQDTNSKVKRVLRIECYCLGSLITQCPFVVVYNYVDKREGEYKYVLNEQQTNLQHQHIEQYIPFKDTKFMQLYSQLTPCILPSNVENVKNLKQRLYDYYMNEIAPRVIKQKFERRRSILLSMNQKILRKIFKLGLIIQTNNIQFKKYEQIKRNSLLLLQQEKLQNDIILLINPEMQKFFKIYNRLLVIQDQKVHQNFVNHKKYSIYKFKGISYTGSDIFLGVAMICDVDQSKINLLLQKFMTKNIIIPNMLLISQSDKLLYDVVHKYFDYNYPQTVIRTRQLYRKKNNKIFIQPKSSQIQYILLTITEMQKKYLQLTNQNNQNFNMLKNSIGQLFNYENLLKNNSCFLENGSFTGLDLKTAAHFYSLKPTRQNILNQTNISQAQNKFLQIIKSSLKINKKQFDKQMYHLGVQKILKMSQLQNLRILMNRRPFKAFLLRLLKVPNVSISVSNPPNFYIVQCNFASNIVTMNPARKNPLLLCDCRVREKTGIPCEHIIKIAIIQQLNLMDCIDKFWLVDSLAAQKYASDFSLEQIMKSKISPMYAMSQGRKRVFDKLFKQMRRKKFRKTTRVNKINGLKQELIDE